MTAGADAMQSNPVARLADSIPGQLALVLSVGGRLLGAALALYYAYDQDTLFPGEHFPRTWAFVGVVAAVAAISCLPMRYRGAAFVAAFGAGMVVMGGANLAHKPVGAAVLICGIVAWLATAAYNHSRGDSIASTVSGLFMASLATFLLVGAIVFTIEN